MQALLFVTALASAAISLCALAYPALTGQFYIGTDLALFHVPTRVFYQEALTSGHSFLWYPYSFNGYHVVAEGQSAFFHPLNLLGYRFLPFEAAFNLEFIRSYLFLIVGGFFFFWRVGVGAGPAMLGSLAFTLCGFNLFHYMHLNMVAAAAHIPWLLLATDVVIRSSKATHVAVATLAIVLITASALLSGHPQAVWMSVLLQALYAAFWLWRRGQLLSGRSLRLIAAQLLGLVCAGIQVIPLIEGALGSYRGDLANIPVEFANSFSASPSHLSQMLTPYLTGRGSFFFWTVETDFYLGSLFPVLAVWLLIRWRHLGKWRPWAGFAFVLLGLSIVLSWGDYGGLYRLKEFIPVINRFRAPGRYVLLVHFAASLLLAIGFADLCRLSSKGPGALRSIWLFLPAASSALLSLYLLASDSLLREYVRDLNRPEIAGPALLTGAAILVLAAARKVPGALAAIIIYATIDLCAYGLPFVWQDEPTSLAAYRSFAIEKFQEATAGSPQGERVGEADHSTELIGVRKFTGYRALYREVDLGFYPLLEAAEDSQEKRTLANLMLSVSAAMPYFSDTGVQKPMPRTRLVTRSIRGEPSYFDLVLTNPETTATTEEHLSLAPGTPGTAEILDDRPGFIRISTHADSEQLLVVSEAHHEGWVARRSAETKKVFRVYGGLAMGILVGPGQEETVLNFEPTSVLYGKWLSLVGACITALWFLFELRPGHR